MKSELLTHFCTQTTFHGFADLTISSSTALRAVWLSVMLVAHGYCCFLVGSLIQLYVKAPVITEMSFKPLANVPKLYFAPADPLDKLKLREQNISKAEADNLRAIIDTRLRISVIKEANRVSRIVLNNTDSYNGSRFVEKIQRTMFRVFNGRNRQNYDAPQTHQLANPANFSQTVRTLIRNPSLIGNGSFFDIDTEVDNVLFDFDGVWYPLILTTGDIGHKPAPGEELYIYKTDYGEPDDRLFSRLALQMGVSVEILDVLHGHSNIFTIQATVEHKIKNCEANPVERLNDQRRCKNLGVQDIQNCCICNIPPGQCPARINRCCNPNDLSLNTTQIDAYVWNCLTKQGYACESGKKESTLVQRASRGTGDTTCVMLPSCNQYIFEVTSVRVPLDDGTPAGQVSKALLDATIAVTFSNTERTPIFTETPRFNFNDALSAVGGYLGLLVGGSMISVCQIGFICLNWVIGRKTVGQDFNETKTGFA